MNEPISENLKDDEKHLATLVNQVFDKLETRQRRWAFAASSYVIVTILSLLVLLTIAKLVPDNTTGLNILLIGGIILAASFIAALIVFRRKN